MEPVNNPGSGIRKVPPGINIVFCGVYAGIPRGFYAEYKGVIFRFKCAFDDAQDDYENFFTIAAIPGAVAEDFTTGKFYQNTYEEIPLETIAVSEVFSLDPMRKTSRSPKFEIIAEEYIARCQYPAVLSERCFDYVIDTPRTLFFLYLDKIIAGFFLLLGTASVIALGFSERNIFLFVIAALALLNPWTPNRWRLYRHATWNTRAWEEYLVVFSEEGIRFQNTGVVVESSWDQYERFLENPALFVLIHRKRDKKHWYYTLVPKRGFDSSVAIGELRTLLARKLRK